MDGIAANSNIRTLVAVVVVVVAVVVRLMKYSSYTNLYLPIKNSLNVANE